MSCNILLVFMWKHFKRLIYYWKSVLFSIILPLVIISLLLKYTSNTNYSNDYYKDLINSNSEFKGNFPSGIEDKLLYYPANDYFEDIMDIVIRNMDLIAERVIGFKSKEELIKYYDSTNRSTTYCIMFDDKNPTSLSYTIRTKNNYFDTEKFYADSLYFSTFKTSTQYMTSGFLELQLSINTAYIEKLGGNINVEYELELNPSQQVKTPKSVQMFAWTTILCFMIIFLTLTLQPIVEEKQDGIKEILNIATTYSFMNQVALFIINSIFCIGLIIILIGQAIYYEIFDCTNIILPIILLILYCICMICFTYFFSVVFETVYFASLIGFVFYFIPILLFDFGLGSSFIMNFKFLSPNTMFLNGMQIFDDYLNSQRCFSVSNLFDSSYPIKSYSLFKIYISLILTSILYGFLYYYLSNIFPGKYGTPKSFYFMCLPSFYSRNKKQKSSHSFENNLNQNTQTDVVTIDNLTKEFSSFPYQSKKVAVKNTTFSLSRNITTVLLGHNGAGKTTTMMMIVGIIPPTSGKIIVDGEDDVNLYRNSIGYCPQNDVFIRYMNCEEHLILFGRLRGLSKSESRREASIILQKVKLTDSAKQAASTLSSGMKRRLCLAAAIIGNTKVIILDEPSSGLDPESKRDLWDILLPLRKERSILLTTHSMEEADILGDKIIIMDHGHLLCQGTPMQLKKRYGKGYTLKIMMTNKFNLKEVLNVIQKYIPNAAVKSQIHPTICITLPYESQDKFSKTFAEIESCKTNLGIESFSVTNTTMEEVFLNSASCEDSLVTNTDVTDSKYIRIENNQGDLENEENTKPQFIILNEILAICYKKMIYLKRSWIKFIIMILFPVCAVILGLYIPNSLKESLTIIKNFDAVSINMMDHTNLDIILVTNLTDSHLINVFKKLGEEEKKNTQIFFNKSIETVFLEIESENIPYYHENIVAGIEISGNEQNYKIKSLFNGNILHSSSFAMNLATNFVLKLKNSTINSIDVINSPLHRGDYNYINSAELLLFFSFIQFLTFGMFAYVLFYLSLPFLEDQSEFKILQNISPLVFWGTTYIFDIIIHMFVCIIVYTSIIICDKYNFLSNTLQVYILFICIAYGFVYIPILYILPKLFKTLSTIYSTLFYILLISSVSGMFFIHEEIMKDHLIVGVFLYLLPDFRLMHGLFSAFYISMDSKDKIYFGNFSNYYDLMKYFLLTLIESFGFLCLLIFVLENVYATEKFKNLFYFQRKKKINNDEIPLVFDSCIESEKNLVDNIIKENCTENYVLVVSNLEKKYYSKKAVNKLSFTVQKGECFGLLGMNGAGKSTTFKMMTLNNAITSGDIFINGLHSERDKSKFKNKFGYCPEMSALLEFMTAYESLKYISWLKGGFSFKQLNGEVLQWLKKMDLEKYTNIEVKNYSGGTKRKLNTALSMITNPSLIFLDEPTSGVDPISRRFMWKCIKEFQKNQKTIVLTSHSMDECEELCNRLGIMAAGQFECIGFIQNLKNQFGKGFTLFIKIKGAIAEEELNEIKLQVTTMYQCTLRDDYAGTLTYNVLETELPWSVVFNKMTEFFMKNSHIIEDYAIMEVTLEDIFLHFRQKQNVVIDL